MTADDAPKTARWGLGDALIGALAGALASSVAASLVITAYGGLRPGRHIPSGSREDLVLTAASLLGLWIGLAGSAFFASRRKGAGSLAADFGLSLLPVDVGVGLAAGIGGQLLLVPLIYLPWEAVDHRLSKQLSEPARQLAGGYHGTALALVGLLIVVGAPLVEEVYFRGLLLRSLLNRLSPAIGRRGGVAVAVVLDGLLFALAHWEPLQFAGLAAFGVVLALLAWRTGRLGSSIVAHGAFNATTVIALAIHHA